MYTRRRKKHQIKKSCRNQKKNSRKHVKHGGKLRDYIVPIGLTAGLGGLGYYYYPQIKQFIDPYKQYLQNVSLNNFLFPLPPQLQSFSSPQLPLPPQSFSSPQLPLPPQSFSFSQLPLQSSSSPQLPLPSFSSPKIISIEQGDLYKIDKSAQHELYIKAKHSHEKKLSIKIDGISFFLIAKINNALHKSGMYSDRNFVNIISLKNNKYIEFTLYTSKSEFGCWRFCAISYNIFKGSHDYISQTFIHYDLQRFINSNFSTLDFGEFVCQDLNDDIKKMIDSEDRHFKSKIIDNIGVNTNSFDTFRLLLKRDNGEFNQTWVNKFFNSNKLIKKMYDFIDKNNDNVCDNNEWMLMDIINNTFIKLLKILIVKQAQYLLRELKIKSIEFLTPYRENIKQLNNITIEFTNFYRILVNDGVNDLYFYCNTYNAIININKNDKSSTVVKNNINNIEIVLPASAKITEYGIYDKITYGGILNYKPADYGIQTTYGTYVADSYYFIGHYLQYLLDFNDSTHINKRILELFNLINQKINTRFAKNKYLLQFFNDIQTEVENAVKNNTLDQLLVS